MMKLLKIAIPTHNPNQTIEIVLDRIKSEIHKNNLQNQVMLEVSINEVKSCEKYQWIERWLERSKLKTSLLTDENYLSFRDNFCKVFDEKSKYTWVIGDDDLIEDGCLNEIISILKTNEYDIVHVGGYNSIKQNYKPKDFVDYVEYTSFRGGGIGATIYRSSPAQSFFSKERSCISSNWPHLHYLISNRRSLSIFCLGKTCFSEIERSKRWLVKVGQAKINRDLWDTTNLKFYDLGVGDIKKLISEDKRIQVAIDKIILNKIIFRIVRSIIKSRKDFYIRDLVRVLFR